MKNGLKNVLFSLNILILMGLGFFSGPACNYSDAQYDVYFQHSIEAYEGQFAIYVKDVPAMTGSGEFLEYHKVEIKTVFENESIEIEGILDHKTELTTLSEVLLEVDTDPNGKFQKNQSVMVWDKENLIDVKINTLKHIFEDGSVLLDTMENDNPSTGSYEDVSYDIPSDHSDDEYYPVEKLENLHPEKEDARFKKGEKVLSCDASFENCPSVEIYTVEGVFGDFVLMYKENRVPVILDKNLSFVKTN